MTGGQGVCSRVGHAARRCCRAADVAEAFDVVVGAGRQRRSTHPPGRVLGDVAVMLADGGVAIGDLAVLPGPAWPVPPGGVHGDGMAGPGLGRRPAA
jgi:hypothetical protein